MKGELYIFLYRTKTRVLKRISYYTCTFKSAMKKFKKNTRSIELLHIEKFSTGYPEWVLG